MDQTIRISLILLAFAASIGSATAEPADRTTRVKVNNDPSQIVCRNEREIGSRLRSTRVCRTRAQWAEYRRETRHAMDKAQTAIQTDY